MKKNLHWHFIVVLAIESGLTGVASARPLCTLNQGTFRCSQAEWTLRMNAFSSAYSQGWRNVGSGLQLAGVNASRAFTGGLNNLQRGVSTFGQRLTNAAYLLTGRGYLLHKK